MNGIARVEEGLLVRMPKVLQSLLQVGDRLRVETDKEGCIVLTPLQKANRVLDETAGLWADRADLPLDGVEYVDQMRSGARLQRLGQYAV
ncbi:MAG: hypothetical protein U9R15_10305 [Chloroflexota bacterium]|nr:hypothetical protein [Chloroflexota bacterium]